MNAEVDKGTASEEALRSLFLRQGCFVVRGARYAWDGEEITDIDLWVYSRTSSLSRARINVDAKNRSSPKAFERIIWASGIRDALKFERCVVATTDKRPKTKAFARSLDVQLIDGNALQRLLRSHDPAARLAEEELVSAIIAGKDDKILGDWRGRYVRLKSRVVDGMNFGGCNAWLDDINSFVEQGLTSSRRQPAYRVAYLALALFLVATDYILAGTAFESFEDRRRYFEDGIRFGDGGRAALDVELGLAEQMLRQFGPKNVATNVLRRGVLDAMAGLRVEVLSAFFCRPEIMKDFLEVACDLEAAAFSRDFLPPASLSAGAQATIGVVLDYLERERVSFFSAFLLPGLHWGSFSRCQFLRSPNAVRLGAATRQSSNPHLAS